MNALNKTLTAAATALVLLSAGNAAFAADTSRQQVISELAQARADGSIAALNADNVDRFIAAAPAAKAAPVAVKTAVASALQGAKTRAQVIAELRASQTDGTLALAHSEDALDQVRLAQIQNRTSATMLAE